MVRGLLLLVVIGFFVFSHYENRAQNQPAAQVASNNSTAVLGARTKTGGCIARGALPDADCTPGTIIPTATKEQICVPGYSKTVRSVSAATKQQVFEEYGIATHTPGEYEVDHLVSLELGGSNDIANLWPESADPPPGFHEKDVVENQLHDQICSGKISLSEAQQQISANWLDAYHAMQ